MPLSTGPVHSAVHTSSTMHATTPHISMRRGLSDIPSSIELSVSEQRQIKIDFKGYAYQLADFLKNFVKKLWVKANELLESSGIKACLGKLRDRFEKRVVREDSSSNGSGGASGGVPDTGEAITGGSGGSGSGSTAS